MPITKEQLLAINNAFASDPGFEAAHSMEELKANPLTGTPTPVLSNAAPPPITSADMPVAGQAAPIVPTPGDAGMLPMPQNQALLDHFSALAAQNRAQSEQVRAFLGPNGPLSQVRQSAFDDIKQAGDITEAATNKQAQGQIELDRQEADQLSQNQRADEQRLQRRNTLVRDYQRKADVLADQAQNMEVRDFWADKSTGSRILGILAQTLSGAANGLAGNPGAPSPLDRIIQRDLELQQSNQQNKRLAADRAQNALAQVYNAFDHEDASIAAYRKAAAQWYAKKSDELNQYFKTDTSHAGNLNVQAQAKQVIADADAKLAQVAGAAADHKELAYADNAAQIARDQSSERIADKTRDDQLVPTPGVNVPVRKALAGSQWAKTAQGFAGSFAQIDRIERLISKPGVSLADSLGADASAALLKGDARQILGTGANLSAEESKDLNSLVVRYFKQKGVNSLSELGAPDAKQLIRAIRTSLARSWQARIRGTFVGADLSRDPGFESAYDAIHAEDEG